MFRSWLKVARPDDWTGTLAWLAMAALLLMLVIAALLARLPARWVALAAGHPALVRAALILVVLYAMGWVRAVAYSRLPAAPYLLGRTLVFRERGTTIRLGVDAIRNVHVELRPPPARESFVIERRDGTLHDLCPVHWKGAARLYAALQRKLG